MLVNICTDAGLVIDLINVMGKIKKKTFNNAFLSPKVNNVCKRDKKTLSYFYLLLM